MPTTISRFCNAHLIIAFMKNLLLSKNYCCGLFRKCAIKA
ncbi:MAG: hypothetical protein AVDCRST_MAG74-291 [uncultured Pyrinomonadaceae bacterium]|uniref:Uncharacterized protein n=1 Tax=uncultured Pyrinomonadaceae bacterium TaxID=2283094 RepID=A0A6J4NBY7_9BACT|nr:MAG: hypothetical protein AVDCRST_MAG74-291 [uncultured Pyrinomonadaceae bacterium]